jgi:hypothetical protein
MAGLAAKPGAAVQDVPSLDKGSEQKTDELGGFVLYLKESPSKTGQITNRTAVVGKNNRVGSVVPLPCYDVFLFKKGTKRIPGNGGGVYPQDELRLGIVTCTDPEHFLPAEVLLPAIDKPGGMIQDRQAFLVKGLGCREKMTLSDDRSQDAIDKTLESFRQMNDLHRLDRFVDCRRLRYPVEKKELVKPDGKGLVNKGMEFFKRMPTEKSQAVVKVLTLTKNPVGQAHGQMAVVGDERAFFGEVFE